MRILIEDDDKRIPNGYRKLSYGEICGLCTAEDWNYLFEHLKDRIKELKIKRTSENNVGVQLVLDSKINTLERLMEKYKAFIELVADVSLGHL